MGTTKILVILLVPYVLLAYFSIRFRIKQSRLEGQLRAQVEITNLMASTDALTRLGNRYRLDEQLTTVKEGDAIVIIDLDNFKFVNDTFGHQTGDDLLIAFADCLRLVVREGDELARAGGDEMITILRNVDVAELKVILARLREVWDSAEPVTTFTAGAAIHSRFRTPEQTQQCADAALYTAKNNGRGHSEIAEIAA